MVKLTKEHIQFYNENGYIRLKNVLSEQELSRVIEEYDLLFKRKNPKTNNINYEVTLLQNLQHEHAVFAKVLYNDSLLDALEDVMGTPNIMLHHTKACYEPPEKRTAYLMHQDYSYFAYEKDSLVVACLHFDAANPENGGLVVYPGSHKLGPLEHISQKQGNNKYLDKEKFPLEKATQIIADRGDIILFSYLLVHGSPMNKTEQPRRMLFAEFAAADDKLIGDRGLYAGYGLMLRGANLEKDAAISKQFE